MLAAIDEARQSVALEMYTFAPGALAERFGQALLAARQRGLRVRVLLDAIGSINLPSGFWKALRAAGGEVRTFNPLTLNRFGIRDHRKLLVCDERVAFIGGFNIASEYDGDGVTRGWCDVGLKIEGPLARELAVSFDEMFARADFQHKRFLRLADATAKKTVHAPNEQLLLSGPGRGRNPIKVALKRDLVHAQQVQIMVAYFVPPWRLRRQLVNVARRGGKVQLILAGKSDVALAQLAGRSLYRRFLKKDLGLYEYQPQILHAKLFIIDGIVYVGSANLDPRSLKINYELMIRFTGHGMAERARELFSNALHYCRRISLEDWSKSRSLWQRLKQRWAYFLLVRVDPYVAQRQWRGLAD
jgi:cardiolipin synthase